MARTAFSQKFQKTCLSLSPSADGPGFLNADTFVQPGCRYSGRQAMFQQGEGVFEQRQQIDFREFVLAWPRE